MTQDSTQNLKVLYLVSLFPCWSETFIVREIAQLLRLGVDVRIFSYKHPCEELVQQDAAAMAQRVVYPASNLQQFKSFLRAVTRQPLLHARLVGRVIAAQWQQPMAMLKTLAVYWRGQSVLQQLGDWRPDVIHAHWATYPSSGAMFLSAQHDLPFGFTSHAHDIFLEQQFIAPKLAAAAHAVTISEYNQRYLFERYGELAADIHTVHCGIDISDYSCSNAQQVPGRVLAVGRLIPMKGFATLIEALAQLQRQGRELHCDLIGDGPLRQELSAMIARLGLQDKVVLHGALPQEQVRTMVQQAAIFVMPSTIADDGDRDGIPVALMEAMALGTAVIASSVSGIPELVEDQHNGLLVARDNAAELASAIDQLAADEDLRARLAQNARARVEAQFNIETEAGKLKQILLASAQVSQ